MSEPDQDEFADPDREEQLDDLESSFSWMAKPLDKREKRKLAQSLDRETFRFRFARWLFLLVVGVVAVSFGGVLFGRLGVSEAKELFALVLTPAFTLLGLCAAFLFKEDT